MIKRLNPGSIQNIKSSSEINNINECILQLVYNSLDAKASLIIVKFNYDIFYVEIIDNGTGIDIEDLKAIGQNNVTSKTASGVTYGYRGEFLCNLIDLSEKVEIISGKETKYIKTFPGCSCTYFDNQVSFGTLIRVFNLFSKDKSRQKQLNQSLDLNSLFSNFEILSLINFGVFFCLEDLRENKILFKSVPTSSIFDKFFKRCSLFKNQEYTEYQINQDDFKISGFICPKSALTNHTLGIKRTFQFLFFNNFYIKNQSYYETVSNHLSSEDQWVFYITVSCPVNFYKIFRCGVNRDLVEFMSNENENKFIKSLKYFVESFLLKTGCKTVEQSVVQIPARFSPILEAENLKNSRTSKTVKTIVHGNQSSLKSFLCNFIFKRTRKRRKTVRLNYPKSFFKHHVNPKPLTYSNLHSRLKIKNPKQRYINQSTQTNKVKIKDHWVPFVNDEGVEFYVNKLNGVSTYNIDIVKESPVKVDLFNRGTKDIKMIKNYCSENSNDKMFDGFMNDLERNILIKWKNKYEVLKFNSRHPQDDESNFESDVLKLDVNTFKGLQVLGQVDMKFIATFSQNKVDSNTTSFSIYLFDQHACHERIRLERLLEENKDKFGSILSDELSIPIIINLNIPTDSIFKLLIDRIRRHGFDLVKELDNYYMTKIPKIISKKLTQNENDFILKVQNFFEDQLKKCLTSQKLSDELKLESGIAQIPLEIMEFFNMEACRGAIKFGDELNLKECQNVIKSLSICKLPFSCAHGRPTIAPIKNIFKKETTRKKLNFKKLLQDF